jgi:hypothetical protein
VDTTTDDPPTGEIQLLHPGGVACRPEQLVRSLAYLRRLTEILRADIFTAVHQDDRDIATRWFAALAIAPSIRRWEATLEQLVQDLIAEAHLRPAVTELSLVQLSQVLLGGFGTADELRRALPARRVVAAQLESLFVGLTPNAADRYAGLVTNGGMRFDKVDQLDVVRTFERFVQVKPSLRRPAEPLLALWRSTQIGDLLYPIDRHGLTPAQTEVYVQLVCDAVDPASAVRAAAALA